MRTLNPQNLLKDIDIIFVLHVGFNVCDLNCKVESFIWSSFKYYIIPYYMTMLNDGARFEFILIHSLLQGWLFEDTRSWCLGWEYHPLTWCERESWNLIRLFLLVSIFYEFNQFYCSLLKLKIFNKFLFLILILSNFSAGCIMKPFSFCFDVEMLYNRVKIEL